jgi:Dolichyl-phosphate-mannose-protein mannosyltransferase
MGDIAKDGRSGGGAKWALAALPAAALVLHVVVNIVSPFEIHRDALLYAAMGRHLRLFRMDFPPFIAIVARTEMALFDHTIWGLRLAPALAHAALITCGILLVRRLGGGRLAAWLAGVALLLSGLELRPGLLFQPVIFDQLWWTAGFLALVLLLDRDEPRWWLLVGASVGIGLLTKFSIAFFAVGALVVILVSPLRAALRTRRPWLAALLVVLFGSPSIIGQIVLGWPLRGQMATLQASQLEHVSAASFLLDQLMFGPVVWLGLVGVVGLALLPRLRTYRPLVAGVATIAAILLVLHGKSYYLGPIWPLLAAAGACTIEAIPTALPRRVAASVAMGLILAGGVLSLPVALPVLSPAATARYAAHLGITAVVRTNRGVVESLPQDFADMLGWQHLAGQVSEVFHALPAGDQAKATIWATNYGRAGAIDWYGPALGLPPAICPVGSYWYFGHGTRSGDVAVMVGGSATDWQQGYREVRLARSIDDSMLVPEERHVNIWVGRGLKMPLDTIWPMLAGRN